jgi:hypothetical protein
MTEPQRHPDSLSRSIKAISCPWSGKLAALRSLPPQKRAWTFRELWGG